MLAKKLSLDWRAASISVRSVTVAMTPWTPERARLLVAI
jgi:hypothetical protein